MAAVSPPSPPMSPSLSRKGKSFARRCERCCCNTILYFPLLIIYGLTTWAVWVQTHIGFLPATDTWTGYTTAFISITLYILLNWSYTTAVFVSPGSPLDFKDGGYSSLPTEEAHIHSPSLTVKASGGTRYCKKCQARKPDRAHHCSTCRRCVLKMDHHCPWLAACVGFRNYKPFVLFLVYTCLFCYICFATSATWVWREIANPVEIADQLMPVNYILLAVIAGIIGLVLSAFTGWHLYLACKGRTTIESLERVRYLAPIRRSMRQQLNAQNTRDSEEPRLGDQLREIHANALPGITRPEEGEDERWSPSPARNSLRHNYADMERAREVTRYNNYLDEQDINKLPNAFDLGWRRNLKHVFGEQPSLWWLPVCNTTGDGWHWEVSAKFVTASEQLAREREARARVEEVFSGSGGSASARNGAWHGQRAENDRSNGGGGTIAPNPWSHPAPPPPDWKRLSTIPSSDGEYASSEDERRPRSQPSPQTQPRASGGGASSVRVERQARGVVGHTANWNDIPDDFLHPTATRGGPRSGAVSGEDSRSNSRGSGRAAASRPKDS